MSFELGAAGFLKWLLEKLAISGGESFGKRIFFALKGKLSPRGLASHIKSLRAEIRAMPFIYRDLELNALDDFVNVELAPIDRRTLQANPLAKRSGRNDWSKVLESKSVILFGEAGIGKTTLFRHLILNTTEGSKDQKIFPAHEKLVPIYVPLKAMDANGKSPILRYITTHFEYFSGKSGIRRLTKLARRSRIFLLLDGYDEIPYVSGVDIIQIELENLFAVASTRVTEGVLRRFSYIYPLLRNGRIFMSTRREFFSTYTVTTGVNTRYLANAGVASHRQELVNKIFRRYKSKIPNLYNGKLNEELFLQRLSQSSTLSVSQISYNPLFLTVLCYTYASHIRDNIDPEKVWSKGTRELIEECVRLLVSDIDKMKVRGLPSDEHEAVMNRRASYADEKMGFLKFLAGACYLDGVSLFESKWATEKAHDFFSKKHTKESKEIISGLNQQDPTVNIIKQLEFSGILVPMYVASHGTIYDFPHRRFREVLAVNYFDSEEKCEILLNLSGNSAVTSFLAYYAHSTDRSHKIALALVAKTLEPNSTLLSIFMQIVEEAGDERPTILRDAVKLVVEWDGSFLPEKLLNYFSIDDGDFYKLMLENSSLAEDARAFFSVSKIVKHVDRSIFYKICAKVCEKSNQSSDVYWIAFAEILENNDLGEIKRTIEALIMAWVDFSLKNPTIIRFAKTTWLAYLNEIPIQNTIDQALQGNTYFLNSELNRLFLDLQKDKSIDLKRGEIKGMKPSRLIKDFVNAPNHIYATFWV